MNSPPTSRASEGKIPAYALLGTALKIQGLRRRARIRNMIFETREQRSRKEMNCEHREKEVKDHLEVPLQSIAGEEGNGRRGYHRE